jgi:mycothiol synthase
MLSRVSTTDAVTWTSLSEGDLDDLAALATRCLAADGGLPQADAPAFLRRRWAAAGVLTTAVRGDDGRLLAAGALRPSPSGAGSIFTGLVDPAARGRGIGSRLLDWGLAECARPVTVETESLTAAARELFAARGLRQVFAEDVMRIELSAAPPAGPWPAGTVLTDWSDATSGRFFAVYEAAFRERPGFPGWTAQEWIDAVADDDEFRPRWSVLASLPGLGDAGFITATVGWIDQVGVAPAARGSGLGAALIGETLTRMRADGATEAWLNVNVNNPASRLYRRLGFEDRGRRARFQLNPPSS